MGDLARISILLIGSGAIALAQAPGPISKPDVTFSYSLANARPPIWGGGALVWLENSFSGWPNFLVVGAEGKITSNLALSVPGAVRTDVFDYSRGSDGTIAACGNAFAADGAVGSFFAMISPDTQAVSVIRTDPYHPQRVTVAPDRTVWTLGYEMIGGSDKAPGVNRNAGVLRHFDKNGNQIGAYISQASIPDLNYVSYGYLAASVDRVGWYPHVTDDPAAYVEVSTSGAVTKYPPAPIQKHEFGGLCLTSSNQVYVTDQEPKTGDNIAFYSLDRQKGAWIRIGWPASLNMDRRVRLIGAEGDEAAFLIPDARTQTVRFARPAM